MLNLRYLLLLLQLNLSSSCCFETSQCKVLSNISDIIAAELNNDSLPIDIWLYLLDYTASELNISLTASDTKRNAKCRIWGSHSQMASDERDSFKDGSWAK